MTDPTENGLKKPTPAPITQQIAGKVIPDDHRFTVTHKMVLGLAVPMTLAYMTTPILGLVDTAVVGQLGDAALIGGLAVGAIIVDLLFTTMNFLRAGTTGLTAQAVGAGDEKEKQAILARALLIAVAIGFILMLGSPLFLAIGLWFMDTSDAVTAATREYFLIRMIAAPAALGNYAVLGWMIGLGRAGAGLALQILLNGTNIIFSIYLGLILELGVAGVATATLIGEALAFMVVLFWCYRLASPKVRPSWARIRERAAFLRLIHLNGDIMIRSFVLIFAFAFFTAQGSRFGEVTLAANAILMHFFITGGYFLDGLATAAEQIVGRAIGAKHRKGFIDGFRLTLFWNFSLAILLSCIFWFGGPFLIDVMTTAQEVRLVAEIYLPWAALTAITGVLAFQMDGVFIGATWSRDMSIMMLVSMAVYLFVWWLSVDAYANHGLWLALHAFLVTRGLTLAARIPFRVRTSFQ